MNRIVTQAKQTMAKMVFYCWLPLILCSILEPHALSLDSLSKQSGIYYQGNQEDLSLEQVDQLTNVDSIKLIVHGFLGSRTHSSIMPLRNAYRAQGYGNILVADWSLAANLDYASSRRAVPKVALELAKQLEQFLAKQNISQEAVHIIGHSLGAHVAGRIGNYFQGSLGRVTGLDPALPLFTPRSWDSLQANAARFVDVIHTDYPLFGDLTPRGTVDFYPNFGHAPQPGCEEVDLLVASKLILEAYSCSHNRAVLFYAESIGLPRNFQAIPCNWRAIKSKDSCSKVMGVNNDKLAYMGEQVTRNATSYYYLETNAAPPFGQGANTNFN